MKANQKSNVWIPKPCHEDWNAMTPEAQGRHCAACNKVVRDFSHSPAAEIEAAIQADEGNVCGRISVRELAPAPLAGHFIQVYPMQRLRFFLMAFVCAFGLQVWGISEVEAQALESEIAQLKSPDSRRTIATEDSTKLQVHGFVKDVFSQEPLELVQVSMIQNGKVVQGILTDENGAFEFEIPKSELEGEFYDLKMNYMDRERIDQNVSVDVRQLAYLIDASVFIGGIEITEYVEVDHLTGVVVMGAPIMLLNEQQNFQKTFTRPLDEWLMMNFSEIHHSGRW